MLPARRLGHPEYVIGAVFVLVLDTFGKVAV